MRLTNKVAIITGAGSGIGRASAYLFAEEGAKVVVADIDDAAGEETAATIKSSGSEAIFVHVDVAVASEVEHLIKMTMDAFGKIDVLFNNAGIILPHTEVENLAESSWERIYAVNVKGIFLAAKYVVPEMKKAGGGIIINTASTAAIRPRPFACAYRSSKGAVITLTKALAAELAPYNIRVNYVTPGPTDTPLISHFSQAGVSPNVAEYLKRLETTIPPLGRRNKPEDIVYAALYFASDESSMVTGIGITVDGGMTI